MSNGAPRYICALLALLLIGFSAPPSSAFVVPEVRNKILNGALATIFGAGFVQGTVALQLSDTVPEGVVLSQDPVAGTVVNETGTAIDVVVSAGPSAEQKLPFQFALKSTDAVPDTPYLWQTFSLIDVNRAGQILLDGRQNDDFSTPPDRTGLFAGPPDFPRHIAEVGQAAPGVSGAVFQGLVSGQVVCNCNIGPLVTESGGVLVPATLAGVSGLANVGLWYWDAAAGNLQLVLREGDPVPGLNSSIVLDVDYPQTRGMRLETGGGDQFVVYSYLRALPGAEPGLVNFQNDRALLKGTPTGGFYLLVRADDPVPGYAGVRWGNFRETLVDDAGRVVAHVVLQGLNLPLSANEGIAQEEPAGLLTLLVQEGDPAPGLPAGWVFGNLSGTTGNVFSVTRANAEGDVLFEARAIEPSSGQERRGYFVWRNDSRTVDKVIAEGDGGVLPGLTYHSMTRLPGAAGDGAFFTSDGRLVLGLRLVDGLGEFAYAATVKSGASFEIIAKTGDHAHGFPDGVDFRSVRLMGVAQGVGGDDVIAIEGYIGGPPLDALDIPIPQLLDQGVWAYAPGSGVQLVLGETSITEYASGKWAQFRNLLDFGYGVSDTAVITSPWWTPLPPIGIGLGNAVLVTPFVLTPEEMVEQLLQYVLSNDLGRGNSLPSKLGEVKSSLDDGDVTGACGQLGAFVNQVEAQAGKALTLEQASVLLADAAEIQAALGCR